MSGLSLKCFSLRHGASDLKCPFDVGTPLGFCVLLKAAIILSLSNSETESAVVSNHVYEIYIDVHGNASRECNLLSFCRCDKRTSSIKVGGRKRHPPPMILNEMGVGSQLCPSY